VVVATLLSVAALVSIVGFHVALAQGQMRLDRVGDQITEVQREYELRRLEVSQLSSPERIVAEAERLGLGAPVDLPTYLAVPGVSLPPAGADDTTTTLQEDWTKVKRVLGSQP
jgi:hypothetical protein